MKNPIPQNSQKTIDTRRTGQVVHRKWLRVQADALLNFFEPNLINSAGGFYTLDNDGQPLRQSAVRQLHDTTRIVHCFAVSKLLDRPNADAYIDQGMDFIWNRHRDTTNGGYFWGVDDQGETEPNKLAYGHAFVLLAASSAKVAGHRDADRLLADVSEVIRHRFWDVSNGTTHEEYSSDWQEISDYRGQNSNMHLTEALMAAYEATQDQTYLDMAQSIAEFFINRHARASAWRVPEHFKSDWQVDLEFSGDPIFRPKGVTPGHALEWSRLLIQLWQMNGQQSEWMPETARNLFMTAVNTGWSSENGGFYYSLDWNNKPDKTWRLWWPCAEAIAAAAALGAVYNDPDFEQWYLRVWDFVDMHFIDHKRGGWFPELDAAMAPTENIFTGKPDLYHALQACLLPLLPTNGSITHGLRNQMVGNT